MDTKIKTIFPGQQADEKVCLIFRQHWILPAAKLAVWFLFLVGFFAVDYLELSYLPSVIDQNLLSLIHLFKIAYLMFLVLSLFIIFTLYYLNVHIITNERIVDITQRGLLNHTISELHLRQIQDVTAEIHGLPENIFDYGDVYIQTAGETERFVFNKVPNPTKVTKLILDLYEQLPDQQKIAKQ